MPIIKLSKEELFFEEYHSHLKEIKPTVLFIHGNFSSHRWWDETIDALPASNHMISVDLRGFGQSSYNNKCKNFGDWAQDLIEMCSILEIQQVFAIGMSFGGGVAMKLAEKAPKLVQKILLTSSVSHEGLLLASNTKLREQIVENPKAKFMLDLLETKNIEGMKQIYEAILFQKMNHVSEAIKEKLISTAFEQKCYLELLITLANSDIKIEQITCPVVLIHGENDKVVTLNSVRSTGMHFKSLEIWEGHEHMLPFEDSERYLQTVRLFIA